MKQKIITAIEKGKVELVEKELKDPGPDEVQVRVHKTLVSPGTERAIILALDNTAKKFPVDMGYSASGIVEKTGKQVTRFKEGDRVACFCINHCNVGNISENLCIHVSNKITFEHAAFLALGVICLQGVRKAFIELGEAVMVLGLGPIGLLALQLAKANGALPAIGVDKVSSRLELAEKLGADKVFNSGEKGWEEELKDFTEGKGPQVSIECTGFPQPINTAMTAVRKFGRVVLLGSTRGETTVNFYTTVHRKALSVIGANIMGNPSLESRPGFWTWKDDAYAFLKILEYGRIDVDSLITDRVAWQDSIMLYEKLINWDTDMLIPVISWV